jgi:tetratricopeptide (TPR) repeat protein
MTLAAKAACDEGIRLFNKRMYEDALKLFGKVQLYIHDYERMDAVLYYSGKSYKELNDSRSALAAFQKILENYPASKYYRYAQLRINELTQIP